VPAASQSSVRNGRLPGSRFRSPLHRASPEHAHAAQLPKGCLWVSQADLAGLKLKLPAGYAIVAVDPHAAANRGPPVYVQTGERAKRAQARPAGADEVRRGVCTETVSSNPRRGGACAARGRWASLTHRV